MTYVGICNIAFNISSPVVLCKKTICVLIDFEFLPIHFSSLFALPQRKRSTRHSDLQNLQRKKKKKKIPPPGPPAPASPGARIFLTKATPTLKMGIWNDEEPSPWRVDRPLPFFTSTAEITIANRLWLDGQNGSARDKIAQGTRKFLDTRHPVADPADKETFVQMLTVDMLYSTIQYSGFLQRKTPPFSPPSLLTYLPS